MHNQKTFRIRTSTLPQLHWQSKFLEKLLHKKHATLCFESVVVDGDVDFEVRSFDCAATPQCVLKREAPGEVLLSRTGFTLETLPSQARVAVSDSRCRGQLLYARKDLKVEQGSFDWDDDQFDAVVASYAEVKRLKREDLISEMLGFDFMLPAPGHAALMVQCRSQVAQLLSVVHDEKTHLATLAERSYFEGLGVDVTAPVAAFAQVSRKALTIAAAVVAPDGSEKHFLQTTIDIAADIEEARADVVNMGRKLAKIALEDGAMELMERV